MGRGHIRPRVIRRQRKVLSLRLHLSLRLESTERGHHVSLEVDHQRGAGEEGPVAEGRGPAAAVSGGRGLAPARPLKGRLGEDT